MRKTQKTGKRIQLRMKTLPKREREWLFMEISNDLPLINNLLILLKLFTICKILKALLYLCKNFKQDNPLISKLNIKLQTSSSINQRMTIRSFKVSKNSEISANLLLISFNPINRICFSKKILSILSKPQIEREVVMEAMENIFKIQLLDFLDHIEYPTRKHPRRT